MTDKLRGLQISSVQVPASENSDDTKKNVLIKFFNTNTDSVVDKTFTLPTPGAASDVITFRFENSRNAIFAAAGNANQPLIDIEFESNKNSDGFYVISKITVTQQQNT